jgi:condensin complex subunit 3
MALDSFGLFIHQSQATEGALQIKIYQIVFDILMLYGVSFLESKGHGVSIFPSVDDPLRLV